MFVRTERLLLRPIWPEDFDELYELLAADYVDTSLEPDQFAELREELEGFVQRQHETLHPHFVITLLGSGTSRPIGVASLHRQGDAVELEYWINRNDRGIGYGEEAVLAILDHARSLGHRYVEAWHFDDNESAGKVLRTCGFEPTGRQRDRYDSRLKFVAPADIYVADLTRLPTRKTVAQPQEILE